MLEIDCTLDTSAIIFVSWKTVSIHIDKKKVEEEWIEPKLWQIKYFRVKMLPGPAQIKLLKTFIPSLATYGAAAGTVVVYMASEWKGKDLLQFVPIYNRYFIIWWLDKSSIKYYILVVSWTKAFFSFLLWLLCLQRKSYTNSRKNNFFLL